MADEDTFTFRVIKTEQIVDTTSDPPKITTIYTAVKDDFKPAVDKALASSGE